MALDLFRSLRERAGGAYRSLRVSKIERRERIDKLKYIVL